MLCFVELKDSKSDFGAATEQIINTYRVIRPKLKLTNEYLVQAFLFGHHGSAPMEHREHQDKLNELFKNNFIYDGDADRFADFLRGTHKPGSHKGKKSRRKK
ncbi:MAG: hypothetical protein V1792_20545 [Pseudomonadota bacterium]